MNLLTILLVAGGTFGLCYLCDKGFQKLFRNRQQHKSGLSVRLNKMYSIFGIVLAFLGVAAIISGVTDSKILLFGGIVVLLVGLGLCVYHLSFGIFYDEDSFVYTVFGKKASTYPYRDIKAQQLYVITGGSVVVELHMADGRTVSVQSTMDGTYPFLDAAFAGWCRQTGRDAENCPFHDPANHLWFPTVEV